jgi:hypothetical protein
MGSIEVGKRADLIVTDGDPMQIITHVDRAFINGVEVPLSSKQTELFKKFRNRRGKGAITTMLDIGRPVAVEGDGASRVGGVRGGGDR